MTVTASVVPATQYFETFCELESLKWVRSRRVSASAQQVVWVTVLACVSSSWHPSARHTLASVADAEGLRKDMVLYFLTRRV